MVSDNTYLQKRNESCFCTFYLVHIYTSKNILKVRKDFRAVKRKCAHVDISFVLKQ